MFDVGVPPPWWFEASDEVLETTYQVAVELAEHRRREAEREAHRGQ